MQRRYLGVKWSKVQILSARHFHQRKRGSESTTARPKTALDGNTDGNAFQVTADRCK
jgi:hypothetical protein